MFVIEKDSFLLVCLTSRPVVAFLGAWDEMGMSSCEVFTVELRELHDWDQVPGLIGRIRQLEKNNNSLPGHSCYACT